MGAGTAIEWCHCTFNPWWGCVEVSPACDHCYARELAKRYGHPVWGKDAPRRFFGEGHWTEPVRWNRRAGQAGERWRVFCASMADIGEQRGDAVGRQMDEARQRLWGVIANTPHLDWLLLTKRPQFYRRGVPAGVLALPNVWPGVTVESPQYLWRFDELAGVETAGPKWISYEPALAWVDFRPCYERGLRWLLIGGENSGKARPFHWQWARASVLHCRAHGGAPFFKQAGAHVLASYYDDEWRATYDDRGLDWPDPVDWDMLSGQPPPTSLVRLRFRSRSGSDPAEWPESLRVREFPA